jgi:hypothetical protein
MYEFTNTVLYPSPAPLTGKQLFDRFAEVRDSVSKTPRKHYGYDGQTIAMRAGWKDLAETMNKQSRALELCKARCASLEANILGAVKALNAPTK